MDIRARTIHPKSYPSNAGTKHLGAIQFEKAFDGGIVVAIALAVHGIFEPVLAQQLLIRVSTILRPAIRVMNAAWWRGQANPKR